MTHVFGELKSEKLAKDKKIANEIVREILNFGANDVIIANVIYQLALNIEDIEKSQALAFTVKEIIPEAFITGMSENAGIIKGG